jgi:hypothetical protein
MSFADRLVLWLHIAFAIFTLGPVALAISSSPRYIRRRELPVLRYLTRITMIFTAASLLVLIFGIVLGQQFDDFKHPWLTVAMTLFVVAFVLLVLIIRDQRSAIRALAPADPTTPAEGVSEEPAGPDGGQASTSEASASPAAEPSVGGATLSAQVASVERGRIAAMGGIVNLIWLVILVLMVWRP